MSAALNNCILDYILMTLPILNLLGAYICGHIVQLALTSYLKC